MISDIIHAYLSGDTTSVTAASVRALNPGKWDTDADVPVYLYKCLGDIWLPTISLSLPLSSRITGTSGQGKVGAYGFIDITPYLFENTFNPEIMQDDQVGSETALVDIIFALPRPVKPTQFSQIYNAELRVRQLLDVNWRQKAGHPATIPPGTSDLSIDKNNYIYCEFMQFLNDPNESEVQVRYKCNYVHSTGLTYLP